MEAIIIATGVVVCLALMLWYWADNTTDKNGETYFSVFQTKMLQLYVQFRVWVMAEMDPSIKLHPLNITDKDLESNLFNPASDDDPAQDNFVV